MIATFPALFPRSGPGRRVVPPFAVALALAAALLAGCPGEDDDDTADDDVSDDDDTSGDDDSGDDDTTEAAFEPLFTFVVIADPHCYGSADFQLRLEEAVGWINDEAPARDIELVLVLGDLAWNNGITDAKAALDGLDVPYVPVIGDNEVHSDDEQAFVTAFTPQWELLAETFDDWAIVDMPVTVPDVEVQAWFNNYAFTHRGVRFVAVDWVARGVDGLLGETGYLHDFDGGTFPWFADQIAAAAEGMREGIIFFGHMPMHLGAFDLAELDAFAGVTGPLADRVYANLAGHTHLNVEEVMEDQGYTVFITDALWDDEPTLRVIEVWSNGAAFEYHHELVIVP